MTPPAEGFAAAAGHVTRCPHCYGRLAVRHQVDLRGQLVEIVEQCGCPEARRLAGICADCSRTVAGTVGKALRCTRHKADARRRQSRASQARHREERQRRESERWRTDAAFRTRKRLRKRERYATDPGARERKRKQHIRYVLRHPDKVAAAYARHSNANRPDRAEMKRRWAHENQTKYVGPGRVPTCAECGAEVPWTPGRGRPHKRCESCDPRAWARKQGQTTAEAA